VVEPPPGLESVLRVEAARVLRRPPGLSLPCSAEKPVEHNGKPRKHDSLGKQQFVEVSISGIPAMLLSDPILKATRCVIACFDNVYEAQRCVNHFHGLLWDHRGGVPLSAKILQGAKVPMRLPVAPRKASHSVPQHYQPTVTQTSKEYVPKTFQHEKPPQVLAADAKIFTPSFRFSAEAAKFVPSFESKSINARVLDSGKNMCGGSETSTELGESETEDESGSPIKVLV